MAPFLPGGARGYAFLLLQILALWVLFAVGMSFFARSGWVGSGVWDKTRTAYEGQDRRLDVVTALCLLLVIYGGINTALARWGQAVSELVKPAHARVVTFLLLMAAIVGPRLLDVSEVIDIRRKRLPFPASARSLQHGPCIWMRRSNDHGRDKSSWHSSVLAVFAVLLNIPAMYRGWIRSQLPRPPPQARRHQTVIRKMVGVFGHPQRRREIRYRIRRFLQTAKSLRCG